MITLPNYIFTRIHTLSWAEQCTSAHPHRDYNDHDDKTYHIDITSITYPSTIVSRSFLLIPPAESTSRKDKDEIERLQKLMAELAAAKDVADKAVASLTVENRGFQETIDALKRQLLDAESQARKDKDAIARLDKGNN